MKPKVLDLFCGAGGLSYGFDKVGFEVSYALDNWKPAVETFKANHPKSKVYHCDISKVKDEQLKEWFGEVSVIVGGPPCQGFSTAGKRALDDPRNRLVKEFYRVVKVLSPYAFVMENVKGFTNFNSGKLMIELIESFEKLNYQLAYGVLDAVEYGVPQKRKRFFLVGIKGLKPALPKPTHGSGKKPYLTFTDATSDLPLIRSGESSEVYVSQPRNEYQAFMRKRSKKLTMHVSPKHKRQLVELIKYVPVGKSAFEVIEDVPEELRPKSGYPNSYKRIKPDEPSPTITRNFTTPSSANCIHPFVDRALTLREGARLQSFTDDYEFVGSFTDKRLLIGNAVPPLLSLAVASSVAKSLAVESEEE